MSTLPPPARTAGRVLAWVVGALLLLALIAAVWIGVRGADAYGHLRNIEQTAGAGTAALTADPVSAAQTLRGLAADAADAHTLTSDPVWRAAEHLPWLGPQLGAFAAVAASGDQLLGGLAPLASAAEGLSLDAIRPVGGRIDPAVLAPLAGPAQTAAARADAASTGIRDIDRAPLVGEVARAVDAADTLFTRVATATDALARTTQLLPGMLGQNGPRTYLVLVQNNAEWRSLGGIAGAGVVLRADNGALSLVGTLSTRDFPGGFAEPVAPLGDEVTKIFDTKPARYIQNVTQVPDFAVGAPLAREMYARHSGVQVDGVIAVDPVVLSYLLQATGPVTLPTGDTLSSDDAVPMLLNQVYFRYANPADQDAFFAGASGAVFQALAAGHGSAEKLVSALTRAGIEHRLLVWSADPGEEAVLDTSVIAGALPVTDARTARFGVYLNDGTGSKMSYYTTPDVALRWGSCEPAGTLAARELTLDVTLTSTAPADAATALPAYITGDGWFGTAPGVTEVVSNVYLPEGFELVSAVNSAGREVASGTHEGRRVLTSAVNLAPGESAHLTVVVRATTRVAAAEAIVTPTAQAALSPTVEASCGIG
ncbi:DUF4012 domain-containing protein [Microbacterium dextranolyticum]|uniref:Peptide synthetase n=1 Tax=Microbacterium dextranolyticum TaxID=36806 RepID=A0A9W6HJD5_9MICO|nr:DUF4012 domain-containing protein [Microbacterium dextranolyticum]MBM7462068.1 hypothetical protein [Microbacterium dextranolyticum]GLJ94312.1 hypothetical protein GCM10017591_03730 [Microbacterium dextranolyticum]